MTTPARTEHAFRRSTCQDRSGRTRQRLIEVAAEVFCTRGYEAASTRTIVERAQTNLVSISLLLWQQAGTLSGGRRVHLIEDRGSIPAYV